MAPYNLVLNACGEAHAWLEAKAEECDGELELTSNGGRCIGS